MKTSNLLIQRLGQNVDMSTSVLASILLLPKFQLSKSLVGKGGRHDKGGVTRGTTQVQKTTLGQDNDSLSTFKFKTVHLRLDIDPLCCLHETLHVNFVVKVTNVSNNGIVLHLGHGFHHEDTLVTSRGDEDISKVNNVFQRRDGESLHTSLKSTDGINLSYINDATTSPHGRSTSLANISVSADNSLLSSHHNIRGTHDTVGK
mmetsp:Transcript_26626/g.38924  ORF Transcript_26626/g.38924 Transcript_26626/m.38924 type:complete len:203 (-) Transcript_26626:772-1380(-)